MKKLLSTHYLPLLLITVAFSSIAAPNVYALSLAEAFRASLETNPGYRAQKEVLKQAEEQVEISRSPFMPQVDALGSLVIQDERQFDNGTTTVNKPRSASLRLQQTIYAGGERMSSFRQSERLLKAAEASLANVEQGILLETAEAYMDVLLAKRILDLNTFQVEVLQKQLEATQSRFDLGEVTRTDVAQAEARLATAKAAMVAARGQDIAERAIFEEVVGLSAEGLVWPDQVADIPQEMEGLLQRSYAAHPQVAEAVAQLAAEKQAIAREKSGYLPDITAEVSVTRREGGFSSVGNGDSDEFFAIMQATWPLFKGGETVGRVRQAKSRMRQFEDLYQQSRRQVERELTDAFHSYQTATAELVSRRESTRANKVAYDGVKQETLLGVRTTLDLLDAEEELLQARVDEVTARHDKVISMFRLMAALGTLQQDDIVTMWQPAQAE